VDAAPAKPEPTGPPPEEVVAQPTEAAPPVEAVVEEPPPVEAAPEPEPVKQPEPVKKAPTKSTPTKKPTTTKSTPPPPTKSTGSKVIEPEPSDTELLTSSSKTPAAAAPPALDSLPLTVVDTIIRNNKNVKKCFFTEQQSTGVLPSVSVKVRVETSGTVSAASIAEPSSQKNTALDTCLSSAFRSMQFPAFKGDPLALTYPFKF
jgi:outer membrane biosynthesis protein TonB